MIILIYVVTSSRYRTLEKTRYGLVVTLRAVRHVVVTASRKQPQVVVLTVRSLTRTRVELIRMHGRYHRILIRSQEQDRYVNPVNFLYRIPLARQ